MHTILSIQMKDYVTRLWNTIKHIGKSPRLNQSLIDAIATRNIIPKFHAGAYCLCLYIVFYFTMGLRAEISTSVRII